MKNILSWLKKWFSISWKKLFLILALVPLMWFARDAEFGRIDAFIRDALQFLNDSSEVEKSIVTININGKENNFKRPLDFEQVKKLIDKILKQKPKNVIIALSTADLYYDQNDIRQKIVDYLKAHKNVLLLANPSNPQSENVENDDILKHFPRLFVFSLSLDQSLPAGDLKRRRTLIELDRIGPAKVFEAVRNLGYEIKSSTDFKYTWNWWGSRQAYLKIYPEGTFGSYDAGWFFNDKYTGLSLEGKTVILGSNDEYSFLFSHSVFNLFGKIGGSDYKAYPVADSVANGINLYVTGNYMKVASNFDDIAILFIFLFVLILLNITSKKKITVFVSIVPILLVFISLTYTVSDFYLNFSRSITVLIFLQYLGIPILMINIFKEQESKKLQEINDARIDALLTVSEKVAHDIRSPLSAINIVMTKASFDDPEYKEIFSAAVQRIDETATKILTKYRTKTGERDQNEVINLREIIEAIAKEKRILNSKINFSVNAQSNNTNARALKLDLERIISNILDNSIFALKDQINPKVDLTLQSDNNMLDLIISDNGTGIPKQVLELLGKERITTKSENNQGNGIGLLHAKRVIEKLKGKFEISSRENYGTTIKISLPIA